MKTTAKFNGTFTFVLAIVNTLLIFTFLFGHGNNQYSLFFFSLFIIIPIQLGMITYFEKSDKKKLFKTLTIITTIIYILLVIGVSYLSALGKAYQH